MNAGIEQGPNVHHFTDAQLGNLRSRGLGDILCDNTDLMQASDNVFEAPQEIAWMRQCNQKNKLDISLFVHDNGAPEQVGRSLFINGSF